MYQSQKSDGTLVPVTAFILWPYTARSHPDGYPVVAWAHGTSGVNVECAPSNMKHLWHDFQVLFQLTLNGYVVVASDYAGLGIDKNAEGRAIAHEYLTGPAQGNDILFSVKAAFESFEELSKEFVIIGSSEGGQAAWAAAERLRESPSLLEGHLGTIAISPLTRLLSLPKEGWVIPLLLVMLVPGLCQMFPDFKPEDVLTEKGVATLKTYRDMNGCNTLLFQLPGGHDILKPDWSSNPHVQRYQDVAVIGRRQVRGPLLIIHGDSDPIVSTDSVTEGVEALAECSSFAHISYHILPHVSHVPAMYASQTIWMDWIADRFSKKPLSLGLHRHIAKPIRPARGHLKETNWNVENATEAWQVK